MKIQLQNGWTKESLKARITERVPADGQCVDSHGDCAYFDPLTSKSCAIGSLMPPEEANLLGVMSVECLLDDETLGRTLRETGPFTSSIDYWSFQGVHDDMRKEGPPGFMHRRLHEWIDDNCEDPK